MGNRHFAGSLLYLLCAVIAMACLAGPADGETTAGTPIANTARLTATTADGERSIASNTATLIVAERLDVALARAGDGAISITAETAVPLVLTNRGNGTEAFDIVATPGDASVRVDAIAIDTDGDGRFDPAKDSVLIDGRTAPLAPGATLSLLIVIRPASNPVTATSLAVTARAVTGSGAPGTVFASQGDGGGDAVTGATGASARLEVPLGTSTAAPTLVKSQRIVAPDGSATPVSGAIVTYTLAARFPGPASAAGIADPIPAGTRYVPGTLTLDGAALSDPVDGDAGGIDGDAIAVRLGDIVAASTRTVTFQVKIQ